MSNRLSLFHSQKWGEVRGRNVRLLLLCTVNGLDILADLAARAGAGRGDGGHRGAERAGAPRPHRQGRLQDRRAQDGHHQPRGLRPLRTIRRDR